MVTTLRNAQKGLREALAHPGRVVLGVVAMIGAVVVAAWLANPRAASFTLTSPVFEDVERPWLIARLLTWSLTTFSWPVLLLIAVNAALFGLHVMLTAHYVTRRYRVGRASHTGTFGAVVAMFGFGCASCGSAFLAFFLGGTATATLLSQMPLHGLEFGIVGAMVMAVSAAWSASKIPAAATCAIPKKKR